MTNQPNPPYVELKVLEDGYSVAPGEKVNIPIILVNQGQQPEQVRIGVEGIPLFWVCTKQQVSCSNRARKPRTSLPFNRQALRTR
jgi:hypothetical protein